MFRGWVGHFLPIPLVMVIPPILGPWWNLVIMSTPRDENASSKYYPGIISYTLNPLIEKLRLQLSKKYKTGLDGTLVTCLPTGPRVAGSNPAHIAIFLNATFFKAFPTHLEN